MNKLLLAAGVVLFAACVVFLLLAALNLSGHRHVMDGSESLYRRLRRRTILFSAVGAVLGAAGTVCIILYAKL